MQRLRFGGPNLPPGRHTWYRKRDREGDGFTVQRANPGDLVDVADVDNHAHYLEAGMAALEDENARTDAD